MTRTLLLIAAFLAVMIASFVGFVLTWDADARAPIGQAPSSAATL
ncbi:MAG: hypothetical protein ACU0BF_03485 [Paracoccaceae bacterium]